MIVEYWNDCTTGVTPGAACDVPETPMRARVLMGPDRSDPLNRLIVLGFRYGKFGAKVSLDNPTGAPPNEELLSKGLSALFQFIADHADEIKKGAA